MNVYDPLYGSFSLDRVPALLAESPEFRRLSEVRLLNTISPTLATLGELKRYSHTLGICYLESVWRETWGSNFSRGEIEAFQAAIILHDIGTPPFGHLFEYILKSRSGWSHEAVIQKILKGTHTPENTSHQIFGSRTPDVFSRLQRGKVDVDLLFSILGNSHPLSELIFGSIDFDNLDNVSRMAWALGITEGAGISTKLSSKISVDMSGTLTLSENCKELAEAWLRLRRRVYEVLVFDWSTVSAQAVLSEAILLAMESGALDELSWSMTDDDLLRILRNCRDSKDIVNLEYLGTLPRLVLCVQFNSALGKPNISPEVSISAALQARAADCGVQKPLAYIFQDNGAFEKSLSFYDSELQKDWSIGEKSKSTVVYIFERSKSKSIAVRTEKLLGEIESVLEFSDSSVERILPVAELEHIGGQKRLV